MRTHLLPASLTVACAAIVSLAVSCSSVDPTTGEEGRDTETLVQPDGGDGGHAGSPGTSSGSSDAGADAGSPGAGSGSADAGADAGSPGGPVAQDGGSVCYPANCGTQNYQCGNCQDDDQDGLVDSQDPDCLGPCHNDEGSFDIGIQAAKGGNCDSLECYYDTNAGRGNDECVSSFRCDPQEPYDSCIYTGTDYGASSICPATQSSVCVDTCRKLTPNGCDCFGCCTVTMGDGGTRDIFLGSEDVTNKRCGLESVDDPTACRACTKNPSCQKECGRCQLCLGKDTLPPDCFADGGVVAVDGGEGGGASAQCPEGEQPCGLAGQEACPAYHYCITGCCVSTLLN